MELAARIDALSIELEQRHEELKRHITHTVEHAIVPLLQHVEANSAHGSRCSSRTVSRAASCADVLRSADSFIHAPGDRRTVTPGAWMNESEDRSTSAHDAARETVRELHLEPCAELASTCCSSGTIACSTV